MIEREGEGAFETPAAFYSGPHLIYLLENSRFAHRNVISVAKRQNPFPLILVKNELGAVSESLGPPLSISHPIMTIAGL